MSKKAEFSIRQVVDLTGVSEFTIRGWENRYQAITPQRTESGRRLYSSEDLLKIKALKDLVDSGVQISTIANLTYLDLQDLLAKPEANFSSKPNPPGIEAILQNAEKFNWDKVKKIFYSQREKHKNKDFIFQFILPLLEGVNHLVLNNQFSIAREHILTAMIKEELYCLKNSHAPKKSKSHLVFTTPEGELHEVGILISSTLANLCDKSNLYIGVNTPKQQIVDVCLRYKATHLIISSTNLEDSDGFLSFIHFLDKQLPKEVSLCVGGPVVYSLSVKLKRELHLFKSIDEIHQYFLKLK